MTIKVALQHRTTYTFAEPVKMYPHTVRLRPAPHCRTPVEAYSLTVAPAGHFLNWQQDAFGNHLARLVFPEKVDRLEVTVDLVADLTVINPFDFFVEEYAETFPFGYPVQLSADLDPYLRPVDESPGAGPGPVVQQWLKAHGLDRDFAPERIVDFLVRVNRAVYDDIAYSVRMEPGVQTPDETLDRALGSCRDSAWLLVSVLRQLGLAARFVSGYLVQLVPDEVPLDGPGGPAEDFTDLHAWAEVYVPGAGWIGLDPTSGLFAGEGHLPLSATPHPSSAAPITGATAPVEVSFSFSNSVTRIEERPRVTKPYTDDQWAAVRELGAEVDRRLEACDVRLTMGGEPTFVAAGDTSAPEWETAADGEEKRAKASALAARLRDRWAPSGVVHRGQGKWYPGEPLPRWQIQLAWRADGQPLWRDPSLLADPVEQPTPGLGERAVDLARAIAQALGMGRESALAAYEDPVPRLWDDLLLPDGPRPAREPAPEAADLGDLVDPDVPGDHAAPAAWVVPAFEDPDHEGRWATTRWRTRRSHLYLTVGTSPAGYRLPLASLAWEPGPGDVERSTFDSSARSDPPAQPPVDGSARVLPIADAPRHALVVEERGGHLFVFLPPQTSTAGSVALLRAVEQAAAATGAAVVLEGYGMPFDPGVRTLSVTPDPGVIEVNVQPTAGFEELIELTTTLYDDARAVGLVSEKFDLDGTHTGTGGGNHFTLGGPTPPDSPLLRRPDLLVSLLRFWQHHPALSYVFSGRFIGPTSQAPRVDEGRAETLYELEIAFAELERLAGPDREGTEREVVPAWQVDRALRHLLTDVTGNTHRSEFCIDKLYSPDGERGRLGLLELRGFEMPPHPRMGLVQALLIRALVAAFWVEPYRGPLVAWGTELHDRFLLPSFAAADLHSVVAEVNQRLGFPSGGGFATAWLDPFVEFRFPLLGTATAGGVELEVRQAIEPWHVLGEEVSLDGTARYVDSSVERIEVAVRGLQRGRHVVTCNGIPVPLAPTDRPGVVAGGVRYRAWAPYSALHPTIGVHSPLVLDVVDVANRRSLGGATYHVVHPGGRSYDTYPVNAMEAEARRSNRFRAEGHTPGPVDPEAWPVVDPVDRLRGATSAEQPCTLDLRRYSPGNR
ncbi:transglutaminase family protein [Nocardioides stalactiti]|uniref:transglutaminase family protein n=1 Tax=Nocardioides stalactiti TaxID=2755356 RepID=UPI001603E24A|nr:transglutaminase family protein [Nocardioides stalactiti]